MSAGAMSSRGRVRAILTAMQERERREGPKCPDCGKPKITIRLAVGAVIRTGPGRYRAQGFETARDLGACACAEPHAVSHWDAPWIDDLPDPPMGKPRPTPEASDGGDSAATHEPGPLSGI